MEMMVVKMHDNRLCRFNFVNRCWLDFGLVAANSSNMTNGSNNLRYLFRSCWGEAALGFD